MKVKTQYRQFGIDTSNVDVPNRTVDLSFSSENPVERAYLGEVVQEVLLHGPDNIDLERLKIEGAVLRNHDPDQLLGKVESVSIQNRRGKARVRLGKTELSNDTFSLIQDNILTAVSVGYEVNEAEHDGNTLNVTRWTPLEISFVTNAADLSVGVGRSQDTFNELTIRDLNIMETKDESKRGKTAYDRGIAEGKEAALEDERARTMEITAIAKDFNVISQGARSINSGQSVEEFRQAVLAGMKPQQHIAQASMDNDNGSFNRETVKSDLDTFIRSAGETRGMSITGGATAGGNAVVPFVSSDLETLLREGNPIRALVDVITVNGNDSFEEVVSSGAAGSVYVGESDARPELANPVLNKIVTELKEIYSMQTLTQRLISQSHLNLADWISSEMSISIAELEGDKFVNGLVVNDEPLGLVNQTFNLLTDKTRAFGTIQKIKSGAAALLDDPDTLKDALYSLKAGYRKGSTWVMNSATARVIQKMKDGQGLYIWSDSLQVAEPDVLLGRPVVILESMPDIGAGTLPIFVGDWRQAIRFINGSNAEISADPYSNKPHIDFYSFFYSGFNVRKSEAIKAVSIEA